VVAQVWSVELSLRMGEIEKAVKRFDPCAGRCRYERIELLVQVCTVFFGKKAFVAAIGEEPFSLDAEAQAFITVDEPPFPICTVIPFCRFCRQIDHDICVLVRKGDVVEC
jgi:hypothetical protein